MNNDLISREALKKAIRKRLCISSLEYLTEQEKVIVEEINNAPTVEYTFEEAFQKTVCEQKLYCPKRPHGKWTHVDGFAWWECPFCGMHNEYEKFNFCPNCGARMKGDNDNV